MRGSGLKERRFVQARASKPGPTVPSTKVGGQVIKQMARED